MIFLRDPQHLKFTQGRDDNLVVEITGNDGLPYEFGSDPMLIFSLRRNPDFNETLFTIGVVPNTETGLAEFTLKAKYTAKLNPGTYWYDVALRENGDEYRDVIRCSMFDILPGGPEIEDLSDITYRQLPEAPDIILCSEVFYYSMLYHPEKYAITFTGTFDPASLVAAFNPPSGLAELYSSTYGTVELKTNSNPDAFDPYIQYSPTFAIGGSSPMGGSYDGENSYGLVMEYKKDVSIIANTLYETLSTDGTTMYMPSYFARCIEQLPSTT